MKNVSNKAAPEKSCLGLHETYFNDDVYQHPKQHDTL
jgi:hypothetical protein